MVNSEHRENLLDGWTTKRCRDCSHELLFHIADGEGKGNILVSNCNKFEAGKGFCNCIEFMSPNNLDYIELLAERRGLVEPKQED